MPRKLKESGVAPTDWRDSTMDDLWEDHVRSSQETETRTRQWLEQEICTKVRKLRRGNDFMTYIDINVLVPICDPCTHLEFHSYEWPKPLPDVCGRIWRDGYRALGMSRKQIASVARALEDGYWLPRCWRCGNKIDFAHEENFYAQHVAISEFFALHASDSKHIPAWMKEIVREMFGPACTGCGQEARTIDHIVARTKGGRTEVINLQPLCKQCNAQKADKDVDTVTVTLTFPLRPPPSGDGDLFIW